MKTKKKITTTDIQKQVKNSPAFRRALAMDSFYWFFIIYLSEYVKYPPAPFHKIIFDNAQDEMARSVVITAFRGSGKSTLSSLTYPIWAMITGKKKFIILLSQNQNQAKLMLANIKAELEKNTLLIRDFGPFKQIDDEWSAHTLLSNSYGTRIACLSSGESIRGIKHKENRPDLIILDDVEDMASTRTIESRNKTFDWVTREVIPAGDIDTKTIIIGNKIHEDCLMMRLKRAIEDGSFSAKYMEYPLLDEYEICLWPQKFKTEEDIINLKKSVGSESAWLREFLLRIVPEDDAVILREWIQYYDTIPLLEKFMYTATGVDLAISQNSRADFTSMVSARINRCDDNYKIYILANTVNKRLSFPQTVEKAKELSKLIGYGAPTKLFIEDVGYQRSIIQELKRQGYPAEGVKVAGSDKRARLSVIAEWIKNGNILFPRNGCEALIAQLVGFGYEIHDDLADAFAILITKIMQDGRKPGIVFMTLPNGGRVP